MNMRHLTLHFFIFLTVKFTLTGFTQAALLLTGAADDGITIERDNIILNKHNNKVDAVICIKKRESGDELCDVDFTQSEFGPSFERVISAPLVLLNEPGILCDESTPVNEDINGRVVLISRGVCEYATKIYHAQEQGSVAVIFHMDKSNRRSQQLSTPISRKSDMFKFRIPSALISKKDSEKFRRISDKLIVTKVIVGRRRTSTNMPTHLPTENTEAPIPEQSYSTPTAKPSKAESPSSQPNVETLSPTLSSSTTTFSPMTTLAPSDDDDGSSAGDSNPPLENLVLIGSLSSSIFITAFICFWAKYKIKRKARLESLNNCVVDRQVYNYRKTTSASSRSVKFITTRTPSSDFSGGTKEQVLESLPSDSTNSKSPGYHKSDRRRSNNDALKSVVTETTINSPNSSRGLFATHSFKSGVFELDFSSSDSNTTITSSPSFRTEYTDSLSVISENTFSADSGIIGRSSSDENIIYDNFSTATDNSL